MWFKMGLELLDSAVFRDLRKSIARGDHSAIRVMALIYLFSLTADDRANDLQDAPDLARLVKTTPKVAQIVWDACVKHGVLRETTEGWSAKAWMVERGILGDARPPELKRRARPYVKTPQPGVNPETNRNTF